MKKIFFLAGILMGVLFSAAFAQTFITQVKPVESKHWGYVNLEGKLIIPAQYEKCYPFSEDGYATIYDSKMKQHFFINTQGEKLITEIGSFRLHHGIGYSLDGFHDGLVAIQWGERWGFMNASGKIAIPARYDFVTEFYDGHAVGKIGSTYAVLDAKGGASVVHEKDILEVRHFTENLAPYRAFDKLFGFIGVDGKIAIPARYETVGYFRGGLAWVEVDSGSFGYINTKGEWAIPPQFKAAKNFDPVSGLARVKTTEGVWAYANKSGELLYVKDTDSMGDFSEGLSEGKKGNKKGFYDNTGKWVIEPKFDGTRDFKNGYAAAKMDDKWGIIDKTGKWVIEPKFDGIKDMELVK